jgi:hypothetical protein
MPEHKIDTIPMNQEHDFSRRFAKNLKRSNQHHAANPTRHLKRLLGMMLVTSV